MYANILAVVDLGPDSSAIGRRARAVAASTGASLTLLHVVEYIPIEPLGETLLPNAEVEQDLLARSRVRLQELATELGLPETQCLVTSGNIKSEIKRVAAASGSDLIVIGSRERHGLSLFINLAEDTVLHTAPCDVLAVRVG